MQQCVKPHSHDMVVILLKFPGELLLRMLKCVILPLVVASVITGLGAINAKSCGEDTNTYIHTYIQTYIHTCIHT